ncbi:MAG: DUF4166 domain-containing protein, partial [Pirellulaceae bacterium]
RLVTLQTESGGQLIEAAGPLRMAFELVAEDGGIRFLPRRTWLVGIPLPRWLSPVATARVAPRGERWQVDAQVRLPTGGLIIRYHGVMVPR